MQLIVEFHAIEAPLSKHLSRTETRAAQE
jgi:hypothetical protein